jgi:hypothetical protein
VTKNLFNFNLDISPSNNGFLAGQITCEPCLSQCEKIKKKINNRKLSEIKKDDIDHVINVFDLKS